MNHHCSGYRIVCPKLIGRPWGPDGLYDADDQPCEADVWVTLDGEQGTGDLWIEEYAPECTHEWDDLTPDQQDAATRAVVAESIDRAMAQHEDQSDLRGDR